jgi:hypothetical protein
VNKKQAFDFLDKEGITSAAVQHPTMPKTWVLEWLDEFDGSTLENMPLEEFKTYYQEFISINFK